MLLPPRLGNLLALLALLHLLGIGHGGEGGGLVYLRVGVTELDGDVPLQFVLEPHGLHSRYGLDDRGLAVRDVTYGPDINRRLAADLRRIVIIVIVVPLFVFVRRCERVGRGGKEICKRGEGEGWSC